MKRLVEMIVGNPAVLVWLALAAFAFGALSAGGAAWKVQGWRLDAVQAKFDGFTAAVRAQGEAAKKLADATAAEDKRKKESSDHEYETTIAGLRSDVKRMRDARAGSSFVPAAPTSSRNLGVACFDRAELEQALQRLDSGISGLIEEGDADAVGLNVGRSWAAGIRSGTSLDNPASVRP